ncbi:MAG TPA: 3-phosphoglycerate dehydrogenase family protein [Gemmatimonadaceae bacterium]|jgi:D-3-phosphoglycerate dehydrogenase|nr:3-phosphoglycerate dehydrogenase family protein [Gemmatimonadaceae bacterium]
MPVAAPSRFTIRTLNNISPRGTDRLPRDRYTVSSDAAEPDAIIVRSADMHTMTIPASVKAVGRAGAGTNNVPVAALSKRGVPVFNAPGANANAVKELVIAAILMSMRHVCEAWSYARGLPAADDHALEEAVEQGKKKFVGRELPGRVLGVVGLGAVGVEVANAAHALGMSVVGFDPQLTVERALQLTSSIERTATLDDLFARADVVTVHAPLVEETRNLVNRARLKRMRDGGIVVNFARADIVDTGAIVDALDGGKLAGYVCDFPTQAIKDHPKVVALPHLGASTHEAEENCAVMVADTLRGFLENGTIRHSVNFPDAVLPRASGTTRVAVANENVPNVVAEISAALAAAKLNIANLLNKSRGDLAYTLVDVDGQVPAVLLEAIGAIPGVLSVRGLGT